MGANNTGEARDALKARLRSTGVSRRVQDAMMSVPRDRFVPAALRQWAWSDRSLPIGSGQTISQPSLVARMIDELETDPHDTVLDVGTGSGYQAAILSLLVHTVISVERIESLKESAASLLADLGYGNVEVNTVKNELGWPAGAPYDGIIVGAASPVVPDQLVQQLKVGGRLVIPVGDREEQTVFVVQRTETGVSQSHLEPVRFVPLIGPGAWRS